MSDMEDDDVKAGPADWITTFADLMSLLMCFFVLLLSFSEMDVNKYKQLAGSMKEAFGVQNEIKVKSIPKGTSIIAKEFSPGRPNPTPVKTVQQISTNTLANSLDVRTAAPGENEGKGEPGENKGQGEPQVDKEHERRLLEILAREVNASTAKMLREKLAQQIAEGYLEVEYDHNAVSIRIQEQGSFPSGSADLTNEFLPIIPILREALRETEGAIAVEGHTDNVPINTVKFRSNWELSTERALSFAHALMAGQGVSPSRFMVVGYADARPRAPNDDWLKRAENRRVEILIKRSQEHAAYGL
ncbi:MAG: chemotaxis protein MotB [Candidatus Azotimanducaceae bacterium]|jgi:chemotaxis protein MotB